MKRLIILCGMLCIMVSALTVQGAVIERIYFDSPTGVNIADYTISTGDIPTTVTRTFPKPYFGSERDYGLMPPDPGTDTGNYPDIVTPASPGFQGGNAMWTCTGNTGDGQQHIGWYIYDSAKPPINGDFTAEIIFMMAKLGSLSDPVVDCEYSLQNVFGTDMLAFPSSGTPPIKDNDGASWDFRVFPSGVWGGDNNKLQLHMGGTDGGGEVNIDGPTLVVNTWYHAAIVYTEGSDSAEFFLNGSSQGTGSPHWANAYQGDWWVGAWPSNGANRGMAGWVDALAISDAALAPAGFVLPTTFTAVEMWHLY